MMLSMRTVLFYVTWRSYEEFEGKLYTHTDQWSVYTQVKCCISEMFLRTE